MFDEDLKCSTNLVLERAPLGYKGRLFFSSFKTLLLVLLITVFLTSCKANATLDIAINSEKFDSGKLTFNLKLDDDAVSILESKSFKTLSLKKVFNESELKAQGFKTNFTKNEILISKSFDSQKELQNLLDSISNDDVFRTVLKESKSLTSQDRKVNISVDLDKLRDVFINNQNVKDALTKADVNFDSYKNLMDKAFSSTSLVVNLNNGLGDELSKKFDSENAKGSVELKGSSTRTVFILGNLGALIFLGLFVFACIRNWRTPKLISNSDEN